REEVDPKLIPPGHGKILSPSTLDKIKAILVDKLTSTLQKPRTGIGETSECNQRNHSSIHTRRILLEEGPKPPNIHERLTLPQKSKGMKPSSLHEARLILAPKQPRKGISGTSVLCSPFAFKQWVPLKKKPKPPLDLQHMQGGTKPKRDRE